MSKDIHSLRLPNLASTNALGLAIAQTYSAGLQDRAIICLSGNLGCGKTHLVKATGKALGIQEVINSPTFAVLNEYESGQVPFYHFDFYRLKENIMATGSPVDTLALEISEILAQKRMLAMIEWPEAFIINEKNFFEDMDRLTIKLSIGNEEERLAEIESWGENSEAMLKGMLNTLFRNSQIAER